MRKSDYVIEEKFEARRLIRTMGCTAMNVAYNEKHENYCLVSMGRGKYLAMYIQDCTSGGVYINDPLLPKWKLMDGVKVIIVESLKAKAPNITEDVAQKIIEKYKDIVFKSFWTGTAFETPYGTGRAFVIDLSVKKLLN